MIDYRIIVSSSGTRHVIGNPPGLRGIRAHAFRVTALCGFGIRQEDSLSLSEGKRDCRFCLDELAVIERRQQGQQDTGHAA
jgi:hypothetical protein